MKRTRISCLYSLGPDEAIQVTISIPTAYPDAVSEAKATVTNTMRDILTDVMRQTRGVNQEGERA